jgi:hypothetical protein
MATIVQAGALQNKKTTLHTVYSTTVGGVKLRQTPNVPTSNTIENPEFTYAHIKHNKAHVIDNIQLFQLFPIIFNEKWFIHDSVFESNF